MVSSKKPPLGPMPACITSRARIKQLADAISEYSQYFEDDERCIRSMYVWACEIVKQCEILQIRYKNTERWELIP